MRKHLSPWQTTAREIETKKKLSSFMSAFDAIYNFFFSSIHFDSCSLQFIAAAIVGFVQYTHHQLHYISIAHFHGFLVTTPIGVSTVTHTHRQHNLQLHFWVWVGCTLNVDRSLAGCWLNHSCIQKWMRKSAEERKVKRERRNWKTPFDALLHHTLFLSGCRVPMCVCVCACW